ncbi:non-canonical purine NTP pyrophosphatase [Campylobacterota bacterium]|nr:non-canonical purine NTP pyrophosphatase [Campylobacterota bacterium]
MHIILASGSRHKAREIASLLAPHTVQAYSDLIAPFEIVENGATFAENALIKARAVFTAISDRATAHDHAADHNHTTLRDHAATHDPSPFVLADDSGICVDLLGGAPAIFSARYAGAGASDGENLQKLIDAVKAQGASSSGAHYTAAIALVCGAGEFVSHGWLYGEAITTPRGTNGFGYDPIFVPNGFDQTLGELPDAIKASISHRAEATRNMKIQLSVLIR